MAVDNDGKRESHSPALKILAFAILALCIAGPCITYGVSLELEEATVEIDSLSATTARNFSMVQTKLQNMEDRIGVLTTELVRCCPDLELVADEQN